ncbi:hypothetical protein NPIL_315521 [Nephila pilipes]|uniref:DUF7041 domain-containing protein n=1 Tax=Nephila pilipes TaxID=299642 RepID=A0A8X6N278_NEPPI|nr:hypothetical protein NPIL_315521 [Nephila pilipes]
MAEVTAVKIRPYNFSDPQLRFTTVVISRPTQEDQQPRRANELLHSVYRSRLRTCAENLIILFCTCYQKAAAIVRDINIIPDEMDPYSAIKTQLIQRTGESSQQEIRKLLTGE